MEVKVAVGQLDPTEDARRNWDVALALAERAAGAGARLLVLPEQTMLAQRAGEPERFARLAREAWEWWPAAVSEAAGRLGLALVAGGVAPSAGAAPAAPSSPVSAHPAAAAPDLPAPAATPSASKRGPRTPAGGSPLGPDRAAPAPVAGPDAGDTRPFNVLLAVDAAGREVARQAKTRLYDAFGFSESAMVRPGPAAAPRPVELEGVRFGLVNCYELRFPEHARRLVAAGAEALALGAAWVRGPLKEDQWATLARARAIENCCYVLAAGTRAKDTIGRSMVIDPAGVAVAALADQPQGIALARLDTDRIAEVRDHARSLP
ncbi:MAG: hypothetical protein LBL01_00295 [Bifidobacteriaceae bacterium]|nr:hypothetical protein [Bifidobacteriaceae bacterium]